ncbi:hypothetical protein SKAU_G00032460 [Synaphobranchus kaupii]|uniref:Uncharacterized protein n=1 Tax=Synaphobranchus kaupii TaxID=118154 RepID=A0A9Q1JEA8_SYNKA|nr:hypothetical protein SKAU_G00032460 [Synaphobranchus kaupii]
MNTKRFVNLTAFWTITSVLLITVLGTDKCNYMNVKQSPKEITVDSVTKTNLIPQSVLIAAVCSGTLILFLVSLCVSLWKSVRRRRWDKHSSEGYRDKIRRPDSQIEEEEEKNNDVKDEKNKVNNTEDATCADDVGKLFQVSREDIVEARKKLKVKRACFFRGNGKPNTSRSGHFKRRRSSHLYINSQELKKQSQTQRTPNIGPTQAKHHCTPQKRGRRTRGKQLTAQEIYDNI